MAEDNKPDEQKTERFNMFMSPSEMKAIDDWAWENRVRSKSEAVRRLVQIGMRYHREGQRLIDDVSEIVEKVDKVNIELTEILENEADLRMRSYKTTIVVLEKWWPILSSTYDHFNHIMAMANETNAILSLEAIPSAIEAADAQRKVADSQLADFRRAIEGEVEK